MAEASTGGEKLTQQLLSSGLPLEFLVTQMLTKVGIEPRGYYHYMRQTEQQVNKERSVDIHAEVYFTDSASFRGRLALLLECKYANQGVKWVFARSGNSRPEGYGVVTCLDRLSTMRIRDMRPLYRFDHELPRCYTGVSISNKNSDRTLVREGVHQVRYALPNLIAEEMVDQTSIARDSDMFVSFVAGVIVTTADLYVLRSGVQLSDYENARSLDDIADIATALLVSEYPGDDMMSYCSDTALSALKRSPQIIERTKQALVIDGSSHLELIERIEDMKRYDDYSSFHALPLEVQLLLPFSAAPNNVFVVSYSGLQNFLKLLLRRSRACGRTAEKVTELEVEYVSEDGEPAP